MHYIADLHIHSCYSRATSSQSHLEALAAWSKIKGIDVLATGDFTHPQWMKEIRENLTEAEPGFYKLKNKSLALLEGVKSETGSTRFILSVEISSIYKKNGKTRKVHSLIFAPDLNTADKIILKLSQVGNLKSDGRPILGLDVKTMLDMMLNISEKIIMIPAHIWTPWFSLLGSKSGYDSVEECFEDLSPHIFALETGLSSDPLMNWCLSALDRYSLVSNSDAHSPEKLGREANIFDCDLDYFSMFDALKTKKGFWGTYEFFPEEGKYHFDGHRKCNVVLDPSQTMLPEDLCPVCGRPLTIGVMNRIFKLADRKTPQKPAGSGSFKSLMPLREVIADTLESSSTSKKTEREYARLINTYGNEFNILCEIPLNQFSKDSNPFLKEALKRMREGEVIKTAGYDGEFGIIKIFSPDDRASAKGQSSLLDLHLGVKPKAKKNGKIPAPFENKAIRRDPLSIEQGLNKEQQKAIESDASALILLAGPGTGKTRTLVEKIAFLLKKGISADCILAVTFTNKAALEMKERLGNLLPIKSDKVDVMTFHSFVLRGLKEDAPDLKLVDEKERAALLAWLFPDKKKEEKVLLSSAIGHYFRTGIIAEEFKAPCEIYEGYLKRTSQIDLEGVIKAGVDSFGSGMSAINKGIKKYTHVFVDEFQDLDALQYEFLLKMKNPEISFCVIGDPNQSIYGFRGASPEYFKSFEKDFNAEKISLEVNYRNSPVILNAAQGFLPEDTPALRPVNSSQSAIIWYEAASEAAEAEFVIHSIEQQVGGISHFSVDSGRTEKEEITEDLSFKNIALLCRNRSKMRILKESLKFSGIPFRCVGDKNFFTEKPFDLLWHLLALIENPSSWGSLTEVLGALKFSPRVMQFLFAQMNHGGKVFESFSGLIEFMERQKKSDFSILKSLFEEKMEFLKKKDGLRALLSLFGEESEEEVLRNVQTWIMEFSDFSELLDYVKDNEKVGYDERIEAVSLMTLHASKGLEFDAVFIIGCEEDEKSEFSEKEDHWDEEKRLFYVGMTRARTRLFLSRCKKRLIFGKEMFLKKNRLVDLIPDQNIVVHKLKKIYKRSNSDQMELF